MWSLWVWRVLDVCGVLWGAAWSRISQTPFFLPSFLSSFFLPPSSTSQLHDPARYVRWTCALIMHKHVMLYKIAINISRFCLSSSVFMSQQPCDSLQAGSGGACGSHFEYLKRGLSLTLAKQSLPRTTHSQLGHELDYYNFSLNTEPNGISSNPTARSNRKNPFLGKVLKNKKNNSTYSSSLARKSSGTKKHCCTTNRESQSWW